MLAWETDIQTARNSGMSHKVPFHVSLDRHELRPTIAEELEQKQQAQILPNKGVRCTASKYRWQPRFKVYGFLMAVPGADWPSCRSAPQSRSDQTL